MNGRQLGADILGVPGHSIEVKNHPEYLSIGAALAQAKAQAFRGCVPTLVAKPKGVGPSNVAHWWTVLYLRDFVNLALLRGAVLRLLACLDTESIPPTELEKAYREVKRLVVWDEPEEEDYGADPRPT